MTWVASGRVRSGSGRASQITPEVDWSPLGHDVFKNPHPGTLNVHILPRWKTRLISAPPDASGTWDAADGTWRAWKVTVSRTVNWSSPGFILGTPEPDTIQVISPVNLRRYLEVSDGSLIRLQLGWLE